MSDAVVGTRYLEDFAIGQRMRTGEFQVTPELVRAFAETYDPQPIHLDEAAARSSIFGQLVASGWQMLAVTMRLAVDARLLGSTPIIGVEIDEIRLRRPLRPSDRLTAEAEVVGMRRSETKPDRGYLRLRLTTRNQAGETLVTQLWTLLVPARAG